LAFDLRALRESSGNPTYRTLAKTAGYSATTLGDAAGGVQLPTLEVTLAYVGACGGDVTAWRRRWQEVNRRLATERAAANADAAADVITADDDALDDVVDADAVNDAVSVDVVDAADLDGVAVDLEADAVIAANALDVEAVQAVQARVESSPAESVEPVEPTSGSASEPNAQQGRARTFAPWIAMAAALVGVLVAALGGVTVARQPGATADTADTTSTRAASTAQCPAAPTSGTPVAFTGTTYGIGANVREGASLQSAVDFRIPAGCSVGFSGYCLGDIVMDATAGTPDMRWFIIPGVGEVASAIVHGDPPSALTPQPCQDDVPAPAAISLAVAPSGTGGGVAELTASGSRLWIVGFAAYYAKAGSDAPSRWHQFGFGDAQTGGVFSSAPLRLAEAASAPDAPVPVVAVACLGGDGPSRTAAVSALRPAAPQTLLAPPSLSDDSLAAAEQAACQYPGSPAGS
jgi:hypothetical protein